MIFFPFEGILSRSQPSVRLLCNSFLSLILILLARLSAGWEDPSSRFLLRSFFFPLSSDPQSPLSLKYLGSLVTTFSLSAWSLAFRFPSLSVGVRRMAVSLHFLRPNLMKRPPSLFYYKSPNPPHPNFVFHCRCWAPCVFSCPQAPPSYWTPGCT